MGTQLSLKKQTAYTTLILHIILNAYHLVFSPIVLYIIIWNILPGYIIVAIVSYYYFVCIIIVTEYLPAQSLQAWSSTFNIILPLYLM